MKEFVYVGPLANLGRFGPVRAGSVLRLTNREAQSIGGSSQFVPVGKYTGDAQVLDSPENDPERVRRLEIMELTLAELRELAQRLGIRCSPRTQHRALLVNVLTALKNAP